MSGTNPEEEKFIILLMPHTSTQDIFLAKVYGVANGLNMKGLIKKEGFVFPLGILTRAIGGIPVDRWKNKHLTRDLIRMFREKKRFRLILAPEGTRKKVKRLRRGFYEIALAVGCPVYLGFIDFGTRRLGVGPRMPVTGHFEADLDFLKDFYRGMTGKHPELFDVEALS